MCGIYGVVRTKGPALDKGQARQWARLVGSLAALSTQRGVDSTGVMKVSDGGEIKVLKDAVPAWELMTTEDWRNTVTPTASTIAVIGHTRYATHGAVTQANAHPFVFQGEDGDITAGVHNGVISNHAMLRIGEKVYAVDSANLIAALAGDKVKEWKATLRRAEGTLAVAVARVHGDKATIFLTRRGNPLWVAKIAEFGAIAFASTKDILTSSIKLSRLTTPETAKELDEGVLFTVKAAGVAEGQRWTKPKYGRKNKKTRATKAERKSWGEEHGPGRAMGGNGKEYARCGSCLDWDEPREMHIEDGRTLCKRCKIAADAWPKGAKKGDKQWVDSKWGDGTEVTKAVMDEIKGRLAEEGLDATIEEEIIKVEAPGFARGVDSRHMEK